MRPRARLAGAVVACAFALLGAPFACSTDAVGIEACRSIEEARCEAAEPCGIVTDVAACKRFYRDQCLHGLVSEEKPGSPKVNKCVATIRAAGECKKAGETQIAACHLKPTLKTTLSDVCDIVLTPEETSECRFLIPEEPPVPDAAAEETATADAGSDSAGD